MFKSTLIQAITAIICVLAISLTMSSAVGKYADAVIKASETNGGSSVNEEVGLDGSIGTDDSGTIDTTPSGDDTITDVVPGDDATTPSGDGTTDPATPDSNTDAPQTNQAPKSPVEVLNYYNNAVNKAVSAKVGFSKSRVTDNEKMDGSIALQAMKGLVYQFMGIGAENEYKATVTKGKWEDVAFLYNSKLTASDVTSATCTQSGDTYVITLKLKSGSSAAGKSNPTTPANAALDKCGICVGSEDKGYFDHKTASVIYDAIAGTYAGAEIKENYSNATVKAKIDAKTGNLTELVVEWNQEVTLSKLAGMSATASGISHVTFKDFKY